MNVRQAVPFFSVSNMEESIRFYVDGLGCTATATPTVPATGPWPRRSRSSTWFWAATPTLFWTNPTSSRRGEAASPWSTRSAGAECGWAGSMSASMPRGGHRTGRKPGTISTTAWTSSRPGTNPPVRGKPSSSGTNPHGARPHSSANGRPPAPMSHTRTTAPETWLRTRFPLLPSQGFSAPSGRPGFESGHRRALPARHLAALGARGTLSTDC